MTRSNATERHSVTAARLLAGLAALIFAWQVGWSAFRTPTLGFTAYYTAAWSVLDTPRSVPLYDHRWFLAQVPRAGIGEPLDIFNINPPAAALLFVPIAWLTPSDAKLIWGIANLAFLAATLVVLRRTLPAAFPSAKRGWWLPVLCGLALISAPIQLNMRLGQAYLLLLMLVTLAFQGFVLERDRQTGPALGMMLALKTAGVLLWLALLMERRVRPFLWGGLAVVCVVLASLPLVGWDTWWEYPQWLPSLFHQRWSGVVAYQTIASLSHHLTTTDVRSSPNAPLDAPWLALPLSTAITSALVLVALFALWPLARNLPQTTLRACRFAALLALSVPLQPVGEDYHYALLLPALAVGLLAALNVPARRGRRVTTCLLTGAGAFLIIAPLPYERAELVNGWWSLLAYPRVYGALLLLAGIVAAVVRGRSVWYWAADAPVLDGQTIDDLGRLTLTEPEQVVSQDRLGRSQIPEQYRQL